MTLAVAVAAAATSIGNQDITTSDLGGDTPKAALILYSRSAVSGTVHDHGGYAIGITDGTTHRSVASWFKHNESTAADARARTGRTDKVIHAILNKTTMHSAASFVSWITNGIRINWSLAAADGWLLTVLFFSGSDWTIAIGDSVASSAGTAVSTGFEPNGVILIGNSTGYTAIDSVETTRATTTIGATGWPLGVRRAVQQTPWSQGNRQGVTIATGVTTGNSAYHFENFGQYGVNLSSTASGFTLTSNATASGQKFGYFAIRYTGIGRLSCGSFGPNTVTGDQSFSGFNGAPGGFLLLLSQQQFGGVGGLRNAVTLHTETKGGGFALGSLTSNTAPLFPTAAYATACEDEVVMLDTAGAVNCRYTVASFDSDGITLNFTNAPDDFYTFSYVTMLDYAAPGGGGGGGQDGFGWIMD